MPTELLQWAKGAGYSDKQIGQVLGTTEDEAREVRVKKSIKPWVKQVQSKTLLLPWERTFNHNCLCNNKAIA